MNTPADAFLSDDQFFPAAPTPPVEAPLVASFGASYVQPYTNTQIDSLVNDVNTPYQYDSIIQAAAKEYGLNPQVLKAHIFAESHGNPKAKNGAQVGLGQFSPATAASIGIDPTNPEQSIWGMAQLMSQAGGQTEAGFSTYYGGPNKDKWKANTKQYAANMLALQKALAGKSSADTAASSNQKTSPFLSDEQFGKGAPVPKVYGAAQIAAAEANYQKQQEFGGLKGMGEALWQDIKTPALEVGNFFSNYGKEHESQMAPDLTPDQLASTKLMGIYPKTFEHPRQEGLRSRGIPIDALVSENNLFVKTPTGISVGQVTKMTPEQIHQEAKDYVAKHGGDLSGLEARIAATQDPNGTDADYLALFTGNDPLIDEISNPALKQAVLLNSIKDVTMARQVLANPKGYSKDQLKNAQAYVNFWKDKASSNIWKDTKAFLSMAVNNPLGAARGMLAGVAQNPLVAFTPMGDFGLAAKGAKAAEGAVAAARAAKLSESLASAAPMTEEAAKLAEGAGNFQAAKQIESALLAKKASNLSQQSRAASIGANAALGAGINVADSQAQQVNEYGVAKNLTGAALQGAVGGAILSGAHALFGKDPVAHALAAGKTFGPVGARPGVELPADTPQVAKGTTPFTSGVNKDGTAILHDKNLPGSIKIPNLAGQPTTIDVHDSVGYHERIEAPLMHMTGPMKPADIFDLANKIKGQGTLSAAVLAKMRKGESLSYQEAHEIATWAENNYVRQKYNVDPQVYQKSLLPAIKNIAKKSKTAPKSSIPADLDSKPYDNVGTGDQLGDRGARPAVDQVKGEKKGQRTGSTSPLRQIHILKRKLGLSDDTYRKLLYSISGKVSSKKLTDEEKAAVIAHMQKAAAGLGVAGAAGAYVLSQKNKKDTAEHLGEAILVSPLLVKGGGDRFRTAMDMEYRGSSPREIYTKTGMWKMADGHWATPVSTVNHGADLSAFNNKAPSQPLGNLLHGSIFDKYYPELVDKMTLVRDTNLPSYQARRVGNSIHISAKVFDTDPKKAMYQVAHEFQHAIASYHGWARGSNLEVEKVLLRLANQGDTIEPKTLEKQALTNYRQRLGEVVARQASEHLTTSQEDLNQTFPEDMPDYQKTITETGGINPNSPRGNRILPESSESPEEEKSLIARTLSGDSKAASTLYSQLYPVIKKALAYKTWVSNSNPRIEVEDLVQQSMMTILRDLPKFEGKSSLATWARKVAYNQRLLAFRNLDYQPDLVNVSPKEKESGDPLEGGISTSPEGVNASLESPRVKMGKVYGEKPQPAGGDLDWLDPSPSPDLSLEQRKAVELLYKYLRTLPEKQQKVMQAFFEEDGDDEAAARLGMSKPAYVSAKQNITNKLALALKGKSSYSAFAGKERGSIDPALLKKMLRWGVLAAGGYVGQKELSNPKSKYRLGWIPGMALAFVATHVNLRTLPGTLKDLWEAPPNTSAHVFLDNGAAKLQQTRMIAAQAIKPLREMKIPKEELNHGIAKAIDEGNYAGLSAEGMKAAQLANQFYNKMGTIALSEGILKDLVSNYINREWGDSPAAGIYKSKFSSEWSASSPKDRHALARRFLTAAQGKAYGLRPTTENVIDLMQMYADSIGHARMMKYIISSLKNERPDPNGPTWISKAVTNTKYRVSKRITDKGLVIKKTPYRDPIAIPAGWRTNPHPSLRGYYIHPAIAPALDFFFHSAGKDTFPLAMEVLNSSLKRAETAFSLFHIDSMAISTIGGMPFSRLPHTMIEIGKSFLNKSEGQKAYYSAKEGDPMWRLVSNGYIADVGRHISDPDIQEQFYRPLQEIQKKMDGLSRGLGVGAQKTIDLLHTMDSLVWERGHMGMGLMLGMDAAERMTESWLRKYEKDPSVDMPTPDEIAKQAASYAHLNVGGADWRSFGQEATTRFGRLIAHALTNPASARLLHFLQFSPDWKITALRLWIKAADTSRLRESLRGQNAGGAVKAIARSPLEAGARLLHPENVTDLARQAVIRQAVLYATIFNGINYLYTGHAIWDNKDPTYIDLGDGRKIAANKHFMEGPHAVQNPAKWLIDSLNVIPSEVLDQLLDVQYVNPGHFSPPMQESRIAHAAGRALPFASESLNEGGVGSALLQMAGTPVYGERQSSSSAKHLERIEKAKRAARRRQLIQNALGD